MSKINYQALREAAEKATWGDWDSYKPHRGARGYKVRLSGQAIARHYWMNWKETSNTSNLATRRTRILLLRLGS